MPITDSGFTRPSFEQIESDFKTAFEAKFSSSETTPSTEPEEFLGIMSEVLAQMKNDLYEDVEECYYALFVTTASGVSLERQAYPAQRRDPTYSIATQRFNGVSGQAIPLNFIVETVDDRQYKTTESGTIPVAGYIDLAVQSVLPGLAQNAPIGAIRYIPSPLPDLTSTSNVTPSLGGLDIQTEADYRQIVISQRESDLTSSLLSIINRVRDVLNVSDAFGAENTSATDVDTEGRPPKSFEIIVDGGADADIAQAIFEGKPAGIEPYGDILVYVIDSENDTHEIKFSRVTDKEVFVKVTITTAAGYDSATIQPIIKQRILEYIGGVDPLSVTYGGLGIGEKVYAWKVEGVLFELTETVHLDGVDNISVLLGYSLGTETQTLLSIAARERAFTDYADITIVEV